ncbi:MAG: hypothetical protein B6I34_07885 [Anaerolineaceae bacterium 4572_32.1]|nr:MAG: hypothetical protein B6I34_07885 [Anaerolineaceae bacterium 4572_32.1]
MPRCQVCGKDKPDGEEKKLYSARILKEERGQDRMVAVGRTEADVTTTYGEFVEHRYFLCVDCHTLWDKAVMWPGIGLALIATVALLVISVRQHIDWMFALALFVLAGGIVIVVQLSTDERLKRRAKRDRGSDDPVKVFSAAEYRALLEKQ